jgi:hypothetical protein
MTAVRLNQRCVFSPVPNSQDDDLLAFQIEDHTVISDQKLIGFQVREQIREGLTF